MLTGSDLLAKVKELLLKNNNDLKEENINFKAIKTSGDLNLNKKSNLEILNGKKKKEVK